ncbi:MAG: lipoprotein-releasing ABC transporter permease subunit [Chromatiales bacterium]|nr:lipoprotein-releasing ABC transporter permease subunit [Chromatiales bacterium]
MFRPLELYVGLRYTRAKRRNHFISFISSISILGIMLGVAALILVLSVMNGFHTEVRDRTLSMASHASISAYNGKLEDWQQAMELSKEHPRVVGQAPFVEAQTMLTNGGRVNGALLRGVVPELETSVSEIDQKIIAGDLDTLKPGRFNIILGRELALLLGVQVGDKITVVTPQLRMTPTGAMPRLKRFTVLGIFEVGMQQFDRNVAIVHIEDAAKLLKLGKNVSGVRLKLDDLFFAPSVSRELANMLPGVYRVSDWTQQHRNFFAALRMEKRMMSLALFLIITVAAFNVVSTLVMVVTDKQSDIAILRTLGMSPQSIMGIFIVQGANIGILGTLLGVLIGVPLAINIPEIVTWIEDKMGFKVLDPSVYYISNLPSDLYWDDVIFISIGAFFITLLATLYPAWRAARTQPAEALRYE